jgi:hypothetical protein
MRQERINKIVLELKNMIDVERRFIKGFGSLGFAKLESLISINVWENRIKKLTKNI